VQPEDIGGDDRSHGRGGLEGAVDCPAQGDATLVSLGEALDDALDVFDRGESLANGRQQSPVGRSAEGASAGASARCGTDIGGLLR
jgi:hypothetical protein